MGTEASAFANSAFVAIGYYGEVGSYGGTGKEKLSTEDTEKIVPNSKSEYRNPKQIRISKYKIRNEKIRHGLTLVDTVLL